MTRTAFGASILVLSLFALAGCATEGTERNTSRLDVTAAPGSGACSPASPELQVYGTPHAATYYRVTFRDLNAPDIKRGEAEVAVNPAGIIPAGALDDYAPPCSGTTGHSYQYRVRAVDNLGHVLGSGAYVMTM